VAPGIASRHVLVEDVKCARRKLRKAYRKGLAKGSDTVDRVWRRYRTCDLLAPFVDRVLKEIRKLEKRTDAEMKQKRLCRLAGRFEGVLSRLESIQDVCMNDCLLNGDVVGELVGISYCAMMLAADGDVEVTEWTRGPINECGFNYELACDFRYNAVTTEYVGETGACYRFTQGDFRRPWERTQAKGCDYTQRPRRTPESNESAATE
jgi:hypothetical protein